MYWADYRHRHRVLFTYANDTIDSFRRYCLVLYSRANVALPGRRVTALFNLRAAGPTHRYETEDCELPLLIDDMTDHIEGEAVEEWCSGSGVIARTFEATWVDLCVTTVDIDAAVEPDVVADCSNPGNYDVFPRPAVITGSFQFNIMDLLLPAAVEACTHGVIAHVAGDYTANMPGYRDAWLRNIVATGGVVRHIPNLPLCRRGVRRCQWLIIFKKRKTYKKYFKRSTTCSDVF